MSLADSSRLDRGYIFATDKEISEKGLANSSAVLHPARTVILSRDAGVGKSAILGDKMAVSQHFIAWQCERLGILDPEFLYYWLQLMKPEFEAMAFGSTIKTIGLPYFKKLKITFPGLAEQRRIAAAMTRWDAAISTTESLISAKKQSKQALMQQLLTGKKRLPGFNKPWQEAALEDIADIRSGGTPKTSDSSYFGGGIPWVSIGDMTASRKYLRKTERTLSDSGLNEISAGLFPKGTVLFAMYASIGEVCISDVAAATSQAILGVKPKGELLSSEFVYYVLLLRRDRIRLLGQQGAQANLNAGMVKAMTITFPARDEQDAICSFLSASDRELDLIDAKKAVLDGQKRALMAVLLTGKKRLKA